MNEDTVQQLFPANGESKSLSGLYLSHQLRETVEASSGPFVYSNFLVSLDGRIAVPTEADPSRLTVSPAMANQRDWRLFQELAVQCDIMIVSGPFISKYSAGLAEEMVQVHKPAYADLKAWRLGRGLPLFPDLAVMSRTLAFDIPADLAADGRRIHIFTPANAEPTRVASLREQGTEIHFLPVGSVAVTEMVRILGKERYRFVFSPAGPKIFHQLLQAKLIQRLYLTHAHQLIGRQTALPLVDGPLLDPPPQLELLELYLDLNGANGSSQLLATYELNYVSG